MGFEPHYPQKYQEFQAGLHYLQFGNTDEYSIIERKSVTEHALSAIKAVNDRLWIRSDKHHFRNTKRCAAFSKSINNTRDAIYYRLTNTNITKRLHFVLLYFKTTVNPQIQNKNNIAVKVTKRVCRQQLKSAETHMVAQARQSSRWIAGALAASMAAATAALPAVANAQDQANAAPSNGTVWTEELREFHEAEQAAADYARNNDGVGILIHVGTQAAERGIEHNIGQQIIGWLDNPSTVPQEFITEHCIDPAADEAEITAVLEHFAHMEGVEAQYFLSYMDDTPGTGVTYHINHLIHGADRGEELKPLIQGICTVPDVAESLPIARAIETSSLQDDNAPQTATFTPTIE